MDDSRIPWWLIVLLAITCASLAVWQSVLWKQNGRRIAACVALVYLLLLCSVIGADPRGSTAPAKLSVYSNVYDTVLVLVGGLCLVATVLLLGRPGLRGQLAWFTILSIGNSAVCFLIGCSEVGGLLVFVGVASTLFFCRLQFAIKSFRWSDLFSNTEENSTEEPPSTPWLIGGTGFIVALVLLGTIYYTAHEEKLRIGSNQNRSATPTRSRLHAVLSTVGDDERSANVVDLATGRRADIVTLLAVLTFITMASTMSDRTMTEK